MTRRFARGSIVRPTTTLRRKRSTQVIARRSNPLICSPGESIDKLGRPIISAPLQTVGTRECLLDELQTGIFEDMIDPLSYF